MAIRVAILHDRRGNEAWRPLAARLEAERLILHDLDASLIALRSSETPVIAGASGSVAIFGSLHQASRPERVTCLTEDEEQAIVASGGGYLITRFWGDYLAVAIDRQTRTYYILRAPMGAIPCFIGSAGEATSLVSDLGLFRLIERRAPRPDLGALVRYLIADDVRTDETCIAGVRELRGGWRYSISPGDAVLDEVWTPWHAVHRGLFPDRAESHRRIRDAVMHSTAAMASRHASPLLRLSGGLDSSIVAAALVNARCAVSAVNFVTDDPAGDERRYAAMVATRCDLPLAEQHRRLADIDPQRSDARDLPRPTARLFAQASDAMTERAAREAGADAVFDGGGGDSIFCFIPSARLAADCLLAPEGFGQFWQTVRDIADLAGVSPWRVARGAWLQRYRRSPPREHVDIRFLSPDAKSEAHKIIRPWRPAGLELPGKLAHVAGIAQIVGAREDARPLAALPLCSPLLAQPVVEACLRVPSWNWVEGGHNRSAARAAFASALPDEVIWRRSKGSPDGFLVEILEANRELVRAMLLDGMLADAGILDRAAVTAALSPAALATGDGFYRLLRLVDAEAWLRTW